MYNFLVYLHIAGALGFLASHGAVVAAILRLRAEREPERIRGLLDLAGAAAPFERGFGLLLIAAGITAGFVGSWWSSMWIGTALVLLIVVIGLQESTYGRYQRALRAAVDGAGTATASGTATGGPSQAGALAAVRISPGIIVADLALIAVILALMVFKPF